MSSKFPPKPDRAEIAKKMLDIGIYKVSMSFNGSYDDCDCTSDVVSQNGVVQFANCLIPGHKEIVDQAEDVLLDLLGQEVAYSEGKGEEGQMLWDTAEDRIEAGVKSLNFTIVWHADGKVDYHDSN